MRKGFTATLLGVLAGIAILVTGVQVVNTVTDWQVTPVPTPVMEPTIPAGSLVVSQKTPESAVTPGDIITIGSASQEHNLIGRVININAQESEYYNITFKGDNQALPEPFPYKVRNVTYVEQFHIPYLGWVLMGLTSTVGTIVVSLLTVFLAWYYLFRQHAWIRRTHAVRRVRKARRLAVERLELRRNYGGVEELKQLFRETESGVVNA